MLANEEICLKFQLVTHMTKCFFFYKTSFIKYPWYRSTRLANICVNLTIAWVKSIQPQLIFKFIKRLESQVNPSQEW